MLNLKEHMDLLIIGHDEFKLYCKNQTFCNTCKYYSNSIDRSDCFKKFYTINLVNLEKIYLNKIKKTIK